MEKEIKYPVISKCPWELGLFEHSIIQMDEYLSYELIRTPGGWVWNTSVFIPYIDKDSNKTDIDYSLLRIKEQSTGND